MTDSNIGSCEDGGVLIEELEQHEANWLVRHVLVDQLIERGFEVFTKTDSQASLGKLSFRLVELTIDGRGSLRSREVKRTVRTEVSLRLTSGAADSLVWGHQGKMVHRDQVSRNVLDIVQNDDYSFAKFVVAEQSWNKFVEPVIASSVIGILVYLFFSNR